MVPGMPDRNSSPAMPASRAALATLRSSAAAPAVISEPSTEISAKARPRRITTPGTPPSRTSRLDATPITVTGTSAGQPARKSLEVVGVRRLEQHFRRAADAEPRHVGERSVRRQPAAHRRQAVDQVRFVVHAGRRRHACPPLAVFFASRPLRRSSSPGRALAQAVMLPAPRQTTKSPGWARSWTIDGRASALGSAST